MDISNVTLLNLNEKAPSLASKNKEAAQDFEAFFLSRAMESMYEGVSTDGIFGGGQAEKIFRSMLINEYGKTMAQAGGIGVADYVMDTLLAVQEQQSATDIEG